MRKKEREREGIRFHTNCVPTFADIEIIFRVSFVTHDGSRSRDTRLSNISQREGSRMYVSREGDHRRSDLPDREGLLLASCYLLIESTFYFRGIQQQNKVRDCIRKTCCKSHNELTESVSFLHPNKNSHKMSTPLYP